MKHIEFLSQPAKVSMADEWYDTTDKNHFWMLWRFRIVKRYLLAIQGLKTMKILEVGCGNGINLQLFELYMDLVVDGCDLNAFALEKTPELKGKKMVYDIYDQHPAMINKYDIILLFDVLEHIKDDDGFLRNVIKHLKSNGIIVINVPAHQTLFSRYDKIVGHVRRYSKNRLIKLIEKNNIEIDAAQYWGFFMVPVLYLRKMFLVFIRKKMVTIGFKPPHRIVNALFKIIMRFELWLFKKPPSGTSLFVAGKRSNECC